MKELCAAMAQAFGELAPAVKNCTNSHFRNKYADLGNVIEAIRPVLAKHGLWFVQNIHHMQGHASVETIIYHSSGESMSCGMACVPIPASKNDPHGYGAALTYAKRYGLSTAFGIFADEDEDANLATSKSDQIRAEAEKKQAAAKAEAVIPLVELDCAQNRELRNDELQKLASDVVRMLQVKDKNAIEDMTAYLSYWQTIKPIFPVLKNVLEYNSSKFLNNFYTWKEKTS